MLRTKHTTPQITVTSNGVLGNCPSFNCDYELIDTGLPEVLATPTFVSPTLSFSVSGGLAQADFDVYLGFTKCTINTYDQGTGAVSADCTDTEGGSFIPRIHANTATLKGFSSAQVGVGTMGCHGNLDQIP